MAGGLDLSFRNRMHLAVHGVVARTGIDGLRPVRIRRDGDAFLLETTDHRLHIPRALVWRSYRRGWAARQARISAEFGLGDPFAVGAGETVIDIGANVGDFALAAAARGARVLAVDGDPAVFDCLARNTAVEAGITAECSVLWKEPGPLAFYSAPDRSDSSIFLPPGENVAAFTAEATTLDALGEKHGIGEVTLLKMDAEGAEPEVLEGGRAVLARTRHVAIDTGPERNGEETGAACAAILADAGFRLHAAGPQRRKITMASRAD